MKAFKPPKNIFNYDFVEILNKETLHRSFIYASYKDNKNNFAFAKIWINGGNQFDYSSLVNEKKVYSTLSQLNPEIFKQTGIYIPKFLLWDETEKYSAMLIEMIKNKNTESVFAENQYKKILAIRNFFRKATPSILKMKNNQIENRSHNLALFAFPVFLISSLRFAFIRENLSKLLAKYILSLDLFFKDYPKLIAHKSLEPKNIILSGKRTYLIDFQLTVISNEVIDIVETLFFCWTNKRLRTLILNGSEFKKIMADKKNKHLFQFLLIYTAVHQFAEGVVNQKIIQQFSEFALNI